MIPPSSSLLPRGWAGTWMDKRKADVCREFPANTVSFLRPPSRPGISLLPNLVVILGGCEAWSSDGYLATTRGGRTTLQPGEGVVPASTLLPLGFLWKQLDFLTASAPLAQSTPVGSPSGKDSPGANSWGERGEHTHLSSVGFGGGRGLR